MLRGNATNKANPRRTYRQSPGATQQPDIRLRGKELPRALYSIRRLRLNFRRKTILRPMCSSRPGATLMYARREQQEAGVMYYTHPTEVWREHHLALLREAAERRHSRQLRK